MDILKSKLESGTGNQENYLATIESIWEVFFCQILPTLECMLYQIQVQYSFEMRLSTLTSLSLPSLPLLYPFEKQPLWRSVTTSC